MIARKDEELYEKYLISWAESLTANQRYKPLNIPIIYFPKLNTKSKPNQEAQTILTDLRKDSPRCRIFLLKDLRNIFSLAIYCGDCLLRSGIARITDAPLVASKISDLLIGKLKYRKYRGYAEGAGNFKPNGKGRGEIYVVYRLLELPDTGRILAWKMSRWEEEQLITRKK